MAFHSGPIFTTRCRLRSLQQSFLILFAFLNLLSAAIVVSPTSFSNLSTTTSSAPIVFTTLANGNVMFDLPLPLANAIAANGKQATCEPDTDDRRRGLSSAEACLLSDVQAVAVVVNDRPELASSLLLLPSSCPTLAVGWIETVVLDFFAWARQKSYFPSKSAVGLLHIGTVLTWAVYSIYKSNVYSGSQIVHQVIPAGDTYSSPSSDISASATSSSASSASCPSVTLSATTVPISCKLQKCLGDGFKCGEGPWQNCTCAPSANLTVDNPYQLPFLNAQQEYFADALAFPNCHVVSGKVAPSGDESTWCAYGTNVYPTTTSTCFYTAMKDLPAPITVSLYDEPIPSTLTGCRTTTNTWAVTSTFSPTVLITRDITYTYTPIPSFVGTTSIGCTCPDGWEVAATPTTTLNGQEDWVCVTAPAATPTPSITAAPAPWQVKFFAANQWCTDAALELPGYRLSGSGTQPCTVMPTGTTGTWAKVGYVSMENWDWCITLFDSSICPTGSPFLGDMSWWCGPGQACVALGPGYGLHAYEVNPNPWGTSSWAHAGLSSTIPACLHC